MTVATRNETQAFLLNGTYDIRLGSIAIYASSSGQVIRSVAFNDSVVQVEFDREGSVQLVINSSAKPSQVFADNNTLTMTQSISGLTPASEAWVYDQSSHTLIILADPMSITLIYGTTTSTPIPEFPAALELMIAVGCLAIMLIIRKALNEHYTSQSAARTG
jgi:Zn-dependent metalloprotease